MKTLALCAVIALLTARAETAHSQTIGFKVGPTFSTIASKPEMNGDESRLKSFGGGGFVRFAAGPLNLQAEVLALTKGTKISDPDSEFNSVEFKLGYIEIPVTALLSLGSGPYLFAGPSVAFETSCKFAFEFEGDTIKEDCDGEEEDPNRSKVDVGVVAGAGLQLPIGPGNILLEARHTWGLTNLNSGTGEDTAKNRSIAVFAGFAIPIGTR